MAVKFHQTKSGKIEPCGASVRACPLGEENHYASPSEVVAANLAETLAQSVPAFRSVVPAHGPIYGEAAHKMKGELEKEFKSAGLEVHVTGSTGLRDDVEVEQTLATNSTLVWSRESAAREIAEKVKASESPIERVEIDFVQSAYLRRKTYFTNIKYRLVPVREDTVS